MNTEQCVAFVTGGASGIGEATARLFAARGWRVVLGDINEEGGARVAGEIGGRFLPLDVTDGARVETVVSDIMTHEGRIDALVNAGGVLQGPVRLMEMDLSEIDRILGINAKGTIQVCQSVARRMADAGRGAIVNVGSLNSLVPMPHPAYALSKVAVTRITEILACELGRMGVRVNAVAPGYTLTPAMQARIDKGERDPGTVFDKSALPRWVQPSEVAEAIFFLASPAASAITATLLPVDCGWIAYAAYSSSAAQPE